MQTIGKSDKSEFLDELIEKEAKAKIDRMSFPIMIEDGVDTPLGKSKGTRITLNMTNVAKELEKKFKGKPGKTEIQQSKGNAVIFDLEPGK